jgi:hypothetical protein
MDQVRRLACFQIGPSLCAEGGRYAPDVGKRVVQDSLALDPASALAMVREVAVRVSALRLLLCAVVVIGGSSAARAEPIPINLGYLVFDYEGDFFNIAGEGFQLRGSEDFNVHFPGTLAAPCSICNPTDLVDTSFQTPGEVSLGTGTAFFNGLTYDNVSWRGSLDFNVEPLRFPTTDQSTVWMTAPFVFSGLFRAYQGNAELFSLELVGAGLTGQPFVPRQQGGYQWEEGRLNYVFGLVEQPAPVPEPATMLLIGTGLAGLAAARRRRRKAD